MGAARGIAGEVGVWYLKVTGDEKGGMGRCLHMGGGRVDKGGPECPVGEEAKGRGGREGTQRPQLQYNYLDADTSAKSICSM